LIENVGNLVCPAIFDLGESAKVAILSMTEGDDKPIKYPRMFQAASLLLINKIDLLPLKAMLKKLRQPRWLCGVSLPVRPRSCGPLARGRFRARVRSALVYLFVALRCHSW
jgi:hypothetical protein